MKQRLSTEEFQRLPELAILLPLDSLLQDTIDILLATYPEMRPPEESPHASASLTLLSCAAETVMRQAEALQKAIASYRRATFSLLSWRR